LHGFYWKEWTLNPWGLRDHHSVTDQYKDLTDKIVHHTFNASSILKVIWDYYDVGLLFFSSKVLFLHYNYGFLKNEFYRNASDCLHNPVFKIA